MAKPVYAGTESLWGWVEEATFGTAIADTGNFSLFQGPPPSSPDLGVVRDVTVKFDGSRIPSDANKYFSESGGLRVIPFSDVVLRWTDLGPLLYLVLQNVSEGASTPYTKTFTLTNTTLQPDFSINAGMFATIGIKGPIASNHQKFTSCILRTLTLTADLQGDGRLMASGEFISGFANDLDANFNTGTWTFPTQNYFKMTDLVTAQIEATAIILLGFSITFNNKAVRVGTGSTGNAQNYALATDNLGWSVTGELNLIYDATTDGLIENSRAGTSVKVQIATGTPGAAGHFDFTAYANYATGNLSRDFGRAEGQAISFPFQSVYQVSPANSGIVVTVSDGVDRAW